MSLDRFDPIQDSTALVQGRSAGQLAAKGAEAAAFLKALSHEGRLMILAYLAEGERSVSDLERLLDSRQAAVSQQLARLRLEGLVTTRREGKTIHYSIQDPKVLHLVRLLQDMYG
jgi:DNA-binding transcriptional ArsR family regulator